MQWFLALILLIHNAPECADIHSLRDHFHYVDSEEKLLEFISNYQDSQCISSAPYLAAAEMRKAEYCFWPLQKLNHFHHGKIELESYIHSHPECLEGRYVRVLVQSQLPSFLGYHSDLESDCEMIYREISSSQLPESYQNVILTEINAILKAK